jgi:hypothetical protein
LRCVRAAVFYGCIQSGLILARTVQDSGLHELGPCRFRGGSRRSGAGIIIASIFSFFNSDVLIPGPAARLLSLEQSHRFRLER